MKIILKSLATILLIAGLIELYALGTMLLNLSDDFAVVLGWMALFLNVPIGVLVFRFIWEKEIKIVTEKIRTNLSA